MAEVRQIILRSGTSTEWEASGAVLALGELGFDSTVGRVKTGNGSDSFAALPWSTMSGAEVQRVLAAAEIIESAGTATDAAMAVELAKPGSASRAVLSDAIGEVAAVAPVAAIELLEVVGAGHSYIASASNQLPNTTFVNRLIRRQNLGAYANYGVGGYRIDQVVGKLRSEYTPKQRALHATMCVLNDLGQYDAAGQGVAGATTSAKAFEAMLSHMTAQAVLQPSAASLDFDAQWNAFTSTAVGAIVEFAFDGDACDVLADMGPGAGGTVVVESVDGATTYGSAATGGYLNPFSGVAVKLRGFGPGVHVVRARVTAGMVKITGLAIPSAQPPLVLWWQEGRPRAQAEARYALMVGTYFTALQAVANAYPTVITIAADNGWDREAMTCFDNVHPNALGNAYYAGRAERVLRELEAAGDLPAYLADPVPAAYAAPDIAPWPEIIPFTSDTFTDAAGTALAAHTGEVGATWTSLAGFSGGMVITPAGRVRKADANSVAVVPSGTPADADYAVEADFHIASSVGGVGTSIAVRARVNGSDINSYELRFVPGGTPWRITRRTGVTTVDLATATGNATVGETYRGRLVVEGTTLRAYINQTLVMEVTDATFAQAGKAGIVITGAAASDTTGTQLDNFRAGTID